MIDGAAQRTTVTTRPPTMDPTPDAQAILLLCSALGGRRAEIKPLSPAKYDKLARWLHQRHLWPRDLLTPEGRRQLLEHDESAHLLQLLDRAIPLALSVESWLNQGLWVVTRADRTYPARVRSSLQHGAPPVLFGVGGHELLDNRSLAMVGSRNADSDSLAFTVELAASATRNGWTVVSGAAKGIDTASMQSALEAGGHAVGFVAEGVDRLASNPKWRDALMSGRLGLYAEVEPGTGFRGTLAMARNRLIYAAADAAVVVTSGVGRRSGTYAGATQNLNKGWTPLWVRAGAGTPAGNAELIELGGRPLHEPRADDILSAPHREGHIDASPSAAPPTAAAPAPDPVPDAGNKEPPEAPDGSVGPTFFFDLVWPHLSLLLATETERSALAEKTNLTEKQLVAWMEHARSRGLVRKLRGPVRYVLAAAPAAVSEGCEDAQADPAPQLELI